MLMKKQVVLAALFAIRAAAVAQPSGFNGTWKLDLAQSFLAGDHPRPGYELTKVVEVKSATATVITEIAIHPNLFGSTMPDTKTTTEHAVGTTVNKMSGACIFGMPPQAMTVTSEWQGGTLLITARGGCFGPGTVEERRFFLSLDGKQMTELVVSHQTTGDSEQKYVYLKQK